MTWTLFLILAAAVFAFLAAVRQYVESNKVPKQNTGWLDFKKKYLNQTILFIFLAAFCAIFASTLQYVDNDKISRKNDSLQNRLLNFTFGSKEVPAFTASVIDNKILFSVTNPDKEYPMYNIKIKCRESFYPEVGTLYPNVNKIVGTVDVPPGQGDLWYFVIWYNNTKNFETDIEVKRNTQGALVCTTKYLDETGTEFTPPWKKRADDPNRVKDTAVQHYQPNQHF